jgi:hypothetical protein
MSKDERIRDLEAENRRPEQAAANRWAGFEDEDLRTLTACLQTAGDHLGDFQAAEAERFVREIANEIKLRSPA